MISRFIKLTAFGGIAAVFAYGAFGGVNLAPERERALRVKESGAEYNGRARTRDSLVVKPDSLSRVKRGSPVGAPGPGIDTMSSLMSEL